MQLTCRDWGCEFGKRSDLPLEHILDWDFPIASFSMVDILTIIYYVIYIYIPIPIPSPTSTINFSCVVVSYWYCPLFVF